MLFYFHHPHRSHSTREVTDLVLFEHLAGMGRVPDILKEGVQVDKLKTKTLKALYFQKLSSS